MTATARAFGIEPTPLAIVAGRLFGAPAT